MDIEKIKNANTQIIGKNIEYYNEIPSTHEYAKTIASNKKENGKIILANMQTKGIGTNGRVWYTGIDKNIAMTIILNKDLTYKILEDLTINIAKYMREAIEKLYGYKLEIKKPNDLMINGKKVAGILTTVNTIGEDMNFLLISLGFNVNEESFSKDIKSIATSLKKEFGKDYLLEDIICGFIEILEKNIL